MRRLICTVVMVLAATALGAGVATAAPPAEDSMATPRILPPDTLSGGSAADNDAATFVREPTPSCQHNVGHTIWWRYRPTSNMVVNLNTHGSDFDTILTVYRSTANGLVEVACSDDDNGQTSKLRFTAAEGTPYYIQVAGFSALSGTIQFSYNFRILNDVFANARVITPGFSRVLNNASAAAGRQPGEASGCTSMGRTIWYRVTVSSNRRLTFDTFDSSFDSQVAVWYGTSLAGLTLVGCADDTDDPNGDGSLSWTAIPGRTYYVQVAGFNSAFGTLAVNLLRQP